MLSPEKALLMISLFSLSMLISAISASAQERAGIARLGLPGEDSAALDALSARIIDAGYDVSELNAADLCDPSRLNRNSLRLLVLPDASTMPARSTATIESFLRDGGNIIALNAPLWRNPLIQIGDQWITPKDYRHQRAGDLPENVVFDFGRDGIDGWMRSTNTPEHITSHEVVTEDVLLESGALHVTITDLEGWDTYVSPSLDDPFPDGHTLTVFSAKGGPRTTQLGIEWTEDDGSRWFAVVPLSTEWQRYVLQPKDFRPWTPPPGRGGSGDSLVPENARQLAVGLAFSHTGHLGGAHEYQIGPIGTAAMSAEHEEYLASSGAAVLDTLSPEYKYFEITNSASVSIRADQAFVPAEGIEQPSVLRSSHPRPRGVGFDKRLLKRWVPILESKTDAGVWCGAPATLLIHADGSYKGGVWAGFGIDDPDWYKTLAALRIIGEIAERMRHGAYIIDGGTNYYTYFDDQEIRFGIRAVNLGDDALYGLNAKVTLTHTRTGEQVASRSWDLDINPGEIAKVEDSWKPDRWPDEGFTAVAEIFDGKRIIDRVSHHVHVWQPQPVKEFVTVEDGEFRLGGERWRAHGINYMPSSGIAIDDYEYFEHWIGAHAYDPEVIERDLRHIKGMGFNTVSIFIYHEYIRDQNLLDLLRRLDNLGMKANLSLRPGTPMNFPWEQVHEMIEYYRLWDNDTVFAYDLAWEPMFGAQDARREWDRDWEAWVIERYGSIENAEQDWEHEIPRDDAGTVTNPSTAQVDTDGDWRRMVAAYRRFLDTLLYKKYAEARRLVLTVDPNHPVSFRMAEAGNPTYRWEGRIPYDFPYLAAAVDLLGPEAYGRIGDWERVKPGWFTYEYARWAAPDKPMVWTEMGVSTWDIAPMLSSLELLEFQAEYYTDFYRMIISSGADGVYFWWYPGGFRFNENSDYGIINPDGSDRLVTRVIREHASAFLEGPSAQPVSYWIEIDRDARAEGLTGIYTMVQDDFWAAIDAGHTPGLRTSGTGTTSADCPPVVVGNMPLTGANPPKYLDAVFDLVEVETSPNNWSAIGDQGIVSTGTPIRIRITLTNLGEAVLLSPLSHDGMGGVYVIAESDTEKLQVPLPVDVSRHGSVVIEMTLPSKALDDESGITLTLEAEGRTLFGERRQFQLQSAR